MESSLIPMPRVNLLRRFVAEIKINEYKICRRGRLTWMDNNHKQSIFLRLIRFLFSAYPNLLNSKIKGHEG